MVHVITNQDSGAQHVYPSVSAYEAAEDWYNSMSKDDMIATCAAMGINLLADEGGDAPRLGRPGHARLCHGSGR